MAVVMPLMFFLESCDKNPEDTGATGLDISGEWQLKTVSSIEQSEGLSIYIDFDPEGSFVLFQKVGEGRYRYYEGIYSIDGDVLDGKYSDGHNFAVQYKVRKEKSGERLVLVPLSGEPREREYDAVTIPYEVRKEAVPHLMKSNNQKISQYVL